MAAARGERPPFRDPSAMRAPYREDGQGATWLPRLDCHRRLGRCDRRGRPRLAQMSSTISSGMMSTHRSGSPVPTSSMRPHAQGVSIGLSRRAVAPQRQCRAAAPPFAISPIKRRCAASLLRVSSSIATTTSAACDAAARSRARARTLSDAAPKIRGNQDALAKIVDEPALTRAGVDLTPEPRPPAYSPSVRCLRLCVGC